MVRWVSKLQEETEMARRGENIHKRKDGRWEGRYIKARTPEGKIQWGYIYGTAYAEVKRVLIQKKAEAGFYNLKRTDLTFEALAEVWLHSLRNSIKESTYPRNHGGNWAWESICEWLSAIHKGCLQAGQSDSLRRAGKTVSDKEIRL